MSNTNLEVPTFNRFALNGNWLDAQNTTTTEAAISVSSNTAMGYFQTGWWPNQSYWYCYPTADHKPIKLGMSEVEKLRSAAKRDAKLKKILEKFTDQIEVVVDFK